MRKYLLSFILFLAGSSIYAQFDITGVIKNDDGERLESSAVFLEGTSYGVITDTKGRYKFEDIPKGLYTIKASYLGYNTVGKTIELNSNLDVDFVLSGSIFGLDEIEINGTFVRKTMPFSHKNLEKKEIEQLNLGQDVPYLLKFSPSMVVTSDAGAGIGYTGMRIRGSDPSRINVTINGVPLNDSESQLVFWVDLPDFASSAEDIQIQRGVGPSTNGTSAFGATINVNTNKIKIKPHLDIATSLGSFNTNKLSVSAGTGLLNSKFGLDLRYSLINSAGYIDRASSRLNSFAAKFNYITENSSLNVNVLTGSEVTYQAWNGLPFQLLESNRTYNSAGTEKPGDPYEDEKDDYNQSHVQVHYNKALNDNVNFNATAHYTRGLGFFENYKGSQNLNNFNINDTSGELYDLITRRWLNNHFYGAILELDWKDLEEKNNLIFGLSLNNYIGGHFGRVGWNSRDNSENESYSSLGATEYYSNDADKLDFNTYGKWTYRWTNRLISYVDLQYRRVNYAFEGYDAEANLVNQVANFNFFNPKAGLSYLLNNDSKLYVSYGVANREPNRNDFTESSQVSRPKHETLYNLELGYTLQTQLFYAGINLYNMSYDNQLVLTGAINDVGEYSRTNVKDSYRRGMEIDAGIKDIYGFHLQANATFSENRITSFTEYIDDWDNGGQVEKQYAITDLAFSPSLIFSGEVGYEFLRNNDNQSVDLSLANKFVGKQYIDNTSNDNAALNPYFYSDLLLNYTFGETRYFKQIQFNVNVHNLFNSLYVSNAWVYRFISEGYDPRVFDQYARQESPGVYNLTGLYPQAGRYFMAGLKLSF